MMKITFWLWLFMITIPALAGYPPTTSNVTGDSSNVVTFNYLFPNFSGTHTGTSLSLGNLSVNGLNSGTNASSNTFWRGDGTWAAAPVKATGEVFMTAATSCPSGSIAADGSSLLRSGGTSCGGGSCANLFAAISTTYGTVDGTHFTLPNLKGVFVRGAGSQTISAITYTGTQGTTQGDQFQSHLHGITDPGHTHNATSGAFGLVNNTVAGVGVSGNQGNFNNAAATASATTGVTVGAPTINGANGTPRAGAETYPANVVLLYCIVY